jgi:IS30 family transposase
MKQRPRRYITDTEMALIWDRWEKGDSINAIARDLGRYHSAVQGAMARTGGIRPAPRRRSGLATGPSALDGESRDLA